ncbi:hypothetical protein IMSHALPRED_000255 [Imshaugia aleurites]|uniref:Glycosyltransferase family 31 protein n=1 Tax=Imshaugia aleurites TaxID=172621 RepID=A0A8H3EIB8_9LECA|nr:hypothetical protein IMSHALPRED_000255 [Imshaugia aleurites]
MLLRNRIITLILCLISLASITLIARLSSRRGSSAPNWLPALDVHPLDPCPDKLDWLAGLNLTYPIRYSHRDIVVSPTPGLERASITKLDAPLFPKFQTIDLSEDIKVSLKHCEKPYLLNVPAMAKNSGDASHIIFGISTTLKRLDASVPSLLRWLPNTNAKLFVIVIESEQIVESEGAERVDAVAADPLQKADLEAQMRGLGMDVTLVEPLELQDSFSMKYFSLVEIMYSNRSDKTKWISLLDDDTFFPSIPALVTMLAKYDTTREYYVGALSEIWWAVAHYGMMGFGGAGIFLSIPLAEIMSNNYPDCTEASHTTAGDIRIMECIYLLTETKLTYERDLHQVDVHADLSGVFESGRMPLSLHHWKAGAASLNGFNLPMMHLVADICRDCFLQRWQFGSEMVLTNGYSLALYPKGDLKRMDMERMEETWDEVPPVENSFNRGTDHSLGPTRPKMMLEEEKIQFVLIDSAVTEEGVRQSYLHPGMDGDIDSLFELFWVEGKKGG